MLVSDKPISKEEFEELPDRFKELIIKTADEYADPRCEFPSGTAFIPGLNVRVKTDGKKALLIYHGITLRLLRGVSFD